MHGSTGGSGAQPSAFGFSSQGSVGGFGVGSATSPGLGSGSGLVLVLDSVPALVGLYHHLRYPNHHHLRHYHLHPLRITIAVITNISFPS
jgi:hypothetical protein